MNKRYVITGIATLSLVAVFTLAQAQGPDQNAKRKLQQDLQDRVNKIQQNQQVRNDLVDQKRNIATTTKAQVKEIKTDAKDAIRTATTSAERKEIKVQAKADVFAAQQMRVVRQLQLALDNLKQIQTRLQSRIEKAEQSGRNMTEPKALMAVATTKVMTAQSAIDALKGITPSPIISPINSTSTGTSTATTTTTATTTATSSSTTGGIVDLKQPRKAADNAIKAVKDAREALNAVVRSVAKNMGLKLGQPTVSPTNTATPTETSTESPSPTVTETP